MSDIIAPLDPRLDLVLERTVDVPAALLWRGWTEPELLKKWFTPKPWSTVECDIDLRPGGAFRTKMRSPEGEDFDAGAGCYLEVVPERRLVWTTLMGPGFRPLVSSREGDFPFTAILELEEVEGGTRYRAITRHRTEEERKAHEAMGFHEGWGMALDQLVELASTMER